MTGKGWMAALCLILGSSAWSVADSLGDVARREQDRRKKIEDGGKAPSRIITEDDLPKGGRKPAEPAETAAPPEPAADASARRPLAFIPEPTRSRPEGGPASPPAPETRSAHEREWHRRAAVARAAVESAQWEYDSTRKPSVWSNGTRNKQDEAKARLAAARQAQADLEEEARRTGIPPGWLR